MCLSPFLTPYVPLFTPFVLLAQDWGHPWCAAPALIIPRWMVGLQPTGAGWSAWRIAPQLAGNSTMVSLRAPTPWGMLVATAASPPGQAASVTLQVPASASLGLGQACLAGPSDVAVPPPSGDYLTLDGQRIPAANTTTWGRFLCTQPGAISGAAPGQPTVVRMAA